MIDLNRSVLTATLLSALAAYTFAADQHDSSAKQAPPSSASGGSAAAPTAKSVIYINRKFRFRFNLPASWNGFSIIESDWHGSVFDQGFDKPTKEVSGPLISIRHPLWTEANPRQDIPIMIFTRAQWKYVEEDRIVVSAAPVGPGEIAHNAKYVFALPPRYNYALPEGFEEVEQILKDDALKPY
jgi:hypothetical protein